MRCRKSVKFASRVRINVSRRDVSVGLLLVMLTGCGAPDGQPAPSPGTAAPDLYSPPDMTPALTDEREWFYIHGEMNIREEPSKGAELIRTLKRGDLVQLGPEDETGWAPLYSAGRIEGYVYRASINVQREAPSRSVSGSDGRSGSRSSDGRVYHRGPRGGCYYYSGSGRKEYVDRSYCN